MNWITLLITSGAVYLFIAATFIVVSSFYWYIWHGTSIDTVPWLLGWINGGEYIVDPTYEEKLDGNGTGLDSLNSNQRQSLNELLTYVIILSYMWARANDPTPTPPTVLDINDTTKLVDIPSLLFRDDKHLQEHIAKANKILNKCIMQSRQVKNNKR